jgi:hypothetical protein
MNQGTNFVGQHIFSQLIFLCNKKIITPVVESCQSNRFSKKLKAYEHFVTMLYGVLSRSTSLREIVMGLTLAEGKLKHLNMDYVPPKSTLADGNKLRPSSFFQSIYHHLYSLYKPSFSDSTIKKDVLKNLFLLDASTFSLFKAILKTSGRNPLEGKKKGGIKKNTVIHAQSLMPTFIRFSAAAANDQTIYPHLNLPENSYVVFDKGYTDYAQYATFTERKIFFVTRQKHNAKYISLKEFDLSDKVPDSILRDELIELTYKDKNNKQYALVLRRIAYWDGKGDRVFEYLTNNFELEAIQIAHLYKFRWKIELFFKKLKQNFNLDYFVGDNQNAIEIQIWCALIALLLLSVIHQQHQSKIAFSNFVHLIGLHLLNYISIESIAKFSAKSNVKLTTLDLFNSS